MDTLVEKIAWRRCGVRNDFVGSLRASDDGIRLTGRDPESGLDVALSIPPPEVASVHVSPGGDAASFPCVVLELVHAQPIFLRQVGAGPLHAQLFARKLGAVLQPPAMVAQGG